MSTKRITFYVMRHGEKSPVGPNDLAEITEKGVNDVSTSAVNNLKGMVFDRAYCSLKIRAFQTVIYVLLALSRRGMFSLLSGFQVKATNGFDYSDAPDLDKYKELDAAVKQAAEERQVPITVSLWMEFAPNLIGHLKNKMTEEMNAIALKLAKKEGKQDEYNVLVGCHSPSSELATLTPDTTPMMKETDIMKYVVGVAITPGETIPVYTVAIIESTYIPRGF